MAPGFFLTVAPLSMEKSAIIFMETQRSWKNDLTLPRDLQKWREV